MKSIYRYSVPVDDQPHAFDLSGSPIATACRVKDEVDFWVIDDSDMPAEKRTFVVVGTGQPISSWHLYWGTAISPGGSLVWHLMEVPS